MKRFFGLVLERLVFLSQNLEVGKWRKKRKLKNRKTRAAVSERRRLFRGVRVLCSNAVCRRTVKEQHGRKAPICFADVRQQAGGG